MFSLYHSSQKQFIILSRAVLVASNLAWSMHICLKLYIGHLRLVSVLTSPSICVSRQLFLVHYHFCGTLKQFGPIFSKKRAKIKIQEQFSVRFTSQTNCLLMNVLRDVSRKRALRFGFLITLKTLSFFSLKSSLEFIIIPPHNMQKNKKK